MTYSRVTYLVQYDPEEIEYEGTYYMKDKEFMTLHEALDFAQPKLLMGEKVCITPCENL